MSSRIKLDKGKLKVTLDLLTAKEGKFFIAFLPQLNLCSYSKISLEEAKSQIENAIDLFFEKYKTKAELDRKLLSLGWVRSGARSNTLNPVPSSSIPMFLLNQEPKLTKYDIRMPELKAA